MNLCEVEKAMGLVGEISRKTNTLEEGFFAAVVAMIVEEWCATNRTSTPKEIFEMLAEVSVWVQAECGDYVPMKGV